MVVITTGSPRKPVIVTAPEVPQGRPGPAGPPGGNFVFNYTSEQASQLIDHNLGFEPAVSATLIDTGVPVNVAYTHHSVNQVEIQTLVPLRLRVRLS